MLRSVTGQKLIKLPHGVSGQRGAGAVAEAKAKAEYQQAVSREWGALMEPFILPSQANAI